MLIDLHCHTCPLSACSSLTLDDLVLRARVRGLDGIVLTEHDRWWHPRELAAARERTGMLVLGAVELSTDRGHILAFGLRQRAVPIVTLAEAAASARADSALLYLAHPARDGLLRLDDALLAGLASIEALNGSDPVLRNGSATGLLSRFALPGIGGSDAHTVDEVGRAATRFHSHVHDEASLLDALRAGAYEAVWMG
jgi:predicted metal-dependent phosphoesterase TrpH